MYLKVFKLSLLPLCIFICFRCWLPVEKSTRLAFLLPLGFVVLVSVQINFHPYKNIRIYHEREGRIEKYVPRIPVWHYEACRVMTKGDPEGRIFYPTPKGGGGSLIFSSYVGSGPASTLHPKNIRNFKHPQKNI